MTLDPGEVTAISIADLVRIALAEDVGSGDVTTAATIPEGSRGRATVVARQGGVVAGLDVAREAYQAADSAIDVSSPFQDGDSVHKEDTVVTAEGDLAALLVAERTVLNFLQRLSGVATLTRAFVGALEGTEVTIVDTRKTTPGWRAIEKAAVRAGGGQNHRMGLYDAYLVKENHLPTAGGLAAALEAVNRENRQGLPVEVEARSMDDVDEILSVGRRPDRILCDNFSLHDLHTAVERIRAVDERIGIEASGNVDLNNVHAVATTGVDWISIGALTHSAPALDLSCLIEPI